MTQAAPAQQDRAARRGEVRARGWRGKKTKRGRSHEVLVIDCETTPDLAQRMIFAVWRLIVHGDVVDEGVIVPDDISANDRLIVAHYIAGHPGDLASWASRMGTGRKLRLLTRTEFLREVFYPLAYDRHGLVVGFNLPFDLTRLANDVLATPDGGFRLRMLGGYKTKARQDRYVRRPEWAPWPGNPDILSSPRGDEPVAVIFAGQSENAVKTLHDGQRVSAVSWDERGGQWHGAFVDQAQVFSALFGVRPSLEKACRHRGIDFTKAKVTHGKLSEELIDYCRADVRATAALWEHLQPALSQHADANVLPEHINSGASIGRGYWKTSGIDTAPVVDRFLTAVAAASLFGARVECRIVRQIVPVVVFDRSKAYVRDAIFLGIERLLSARRLGTRPAREDFVQFLEGGELLTRTADREVCKWLARLFVEVRPRGETWHVRAWFQDRSAPSLVTAPFFFDGSCWVSAFDVVVAFLLSGRIPQIGSVLEVVPEGERPRRPVGIAGGTPSTGELLTAFLQRQEDLDRDEDPAAGGLKPMRNSAASGLFAQITRRSVKPARHEVWGPDGPRMVTAPKEVAGAHTCLPLAAVITAFARFLLARVEAKVIALGGVIAAMDTDMVAVVAIRRGSLVPCVGGNLRTPDGRAAVRGLPIAWVRRIVREESWSNPVGKSSSWSEKFSSCSVPTFLYGLCNKRTAIFRRGADGEITLLDASEILTGGRYLSPTGSEHRGGSGARRWLEELWRHLIDPERHPRPSWCDVPAVRPVSIRRPETLCRFGVTLGLRAYNFLCQAELAPGHRLDRSGPVCVFSRNPRDWCRFRDAQTGAPLEPLTEAEVARGRSGDGPVIATLGGVAERWSAAVDDRYEPCESPEPGYPPVGLLRPRPVASLPALAELIGKESTRWGEAFAGEVEPDDPDWISSFGPMVDPWSEIVRPALSRIAVPEVAQRGKLSERRALDLIDGRSSPHPSTRQRLTELAYHLAAASLGKRAPMRVGRLQVSERAMAATIAAWLASEAPPALLCGRSGCLSAARRQYCSDRCRKAANRAEQHASSQAIGGVRCRHCDAVRFGDTSQPCPSCGGATAVEMILARRCPDCGAERVGDLARPCPVCAEGAA